MKTDFIEIKTKTLDQLVFISDHGPGDMDEFEVDLINDTVDRYKMYGRKTQLSKKQIRMIEQIYYNLRLNSVAPIKDGGTP